MKDISTALLPFVLLVTATFAANDATRIHDSAPPLDPRIKNVRNWYHGSGFAPAFTKEQWQARAADLRRQVLVAAGLWPLPDKCDLKPTVHGKVDRGDYTVEKVFFQSHPGFYVTGSLYRPKGKTGPFPGVLCPHGHWNNGRFLTNSTKQIDAEIKGGFEKDPEAAKSPLQARCVTMARMGCVVFHYDMVGYADADPKVFVHRATFRDIESELWGLNVFGLQTWNSIRSVDFLLSLPDVDPLRIACTGASGGGTQTFILMAVEDRLKVAAPVCMISADNHQGGCACENTPLLRIGTDNVEIAATFAPRPFVHPTATGDWTAHFMEKGYPAIRTIYGLFGAESNVHAMRQKAGHNYNLQSRETVYEFFNTHLKLGCPSPVKEQPFQTLSAAELSVFDSAHPRPADSIDPAALKKRLVAQAQKHMSNLRPTDKASLDRYRQVAGPALRHMLATDLPAVGQVSSTDVGTYIQRKGFRMQKALLARNGAPEQLPALILTPTNPSGAATLLVCPNGKADAFEAEGAPVELAARLLEAGHIILAVDVFSTGELAPPTPPAAAKPENFFTGYNRTTIANRAHDVLTAIGYLRDRPGVTQVNLVGLGKAGPYCLLARALAGHGVARTAADVNGFDFAKATNVQDEIHLPGALRYGGLWGLATLAAPGELCVWNAAPDNNTAPLVDAYRAAAAERNLRIGPKLEAKELAAWLSRQP